MRNDSQEINMAESKRKHESIKKGMKLTIVVEEMVNGVLVVVLEHGHHVYRGILMDANQRHGPMNLSILKSSQKDGTNNTHDVKEQQIDATSVDVPATVFRHTYFQHTSPFKTGGPPWEAPFPKIGGNKQTRNIRLRPRQTLCSNCKSTCLDSQNGPIPLKSAVASLNNTTKQQTNLPHSKSACSLMDVKSGSKKLKRQKDIEIDEPKPTKLIKVHNDPPKLTRTTPFIKISIGDTNVMNIPPRLQESDREELSSEAEKCTDNDECGSAPPVLSNNEDNYYDEEEDNEVVFNFKPSLLRQRQEDKSNWISRKKRSSENNHRKSRKSRHKQESDSELPNIIITENYDSDDDKGGNKSRRPRLVYTLHQRKAVTNSNNSCSESEVDKVIADGNVDSSQYENLDGTSFNDTSSKFSYKTKKKRSRKQYKLRSRSRSAESNPEYELARDSSPSSSCEEQHSLTGQSDGRSSSESDSSDCDGPPGDDESTECIKPLMMKIHTSTVAKCSITDGRILNVEDIVWGKVKGFPWWPGRVMTISVSEKDNGVVIRQVAQVAWFGSATMSHIACSDLYPFLEDFKVRFNRKKKSTPYRRAIKQARIAAQSSSTTGNIDFDDVDFSCIG